MKAGLDFKLPFGKYKGLTIKQIIKDELDTDYIRWLSGVLDQGIDKEVLDIVSYIDSSTPITGDMMTGSCQEGYV
tara:strand:- start:93 stop:317 length:225 start_codon:yes stop_codon:yes gene_type:complete